MTSPDIKKLITVFLIASALISSSALIFLSIDAPSTPQQALVANEEGGAIPKNAFVEPLPGNTLSNNLITNNSITQAPSNNLTENLASNLAQEIVKANPNGPQAIDGNPSIAAPDVNAVGDQFTKAAAAQIAKIPDWESDAAKLKIITANADDQDAASAYLASINAVTAKLAKRIGITDPAAAAPAINDLEEVRLAFDRAAKDAEEVPVPPSLMALHKSLIKLLAYERNVAAVALDNTDDPLRSSLILRAQEQNYTNAIFAFQAELQKQSATQTLAPGSKNFIVAFAKDIFSIKTAHAFLGFGDIVFDPALLAKTIWEYAQKVITEQIKEQLIHKLTNQVINWVQGGGKPQFITNWKGFLTDAANNAAGNVIYKIAPQLCSSFGPLIKIAFQQVNTSDYGVSCTLNQVVSNVQNFYDDFRTGGWIAYGAALQPNNNFFGALIETHDAVLTEAVKAKEAAAQEAAANQGFKATRTCNLSDPAGYEPQLTARGTDSYTIPLPQGGYGPALTVYCKSWSNTTPGGVIAGQLDRALSSPIDRIVNAQDWTNLITALINSGLQKLITAGVNGLQGALTGGGGTTAQKCQGLTGQAYDTCVQGGVGGDPARLQEDANRAAGIEQAQQQCQNFTGAELTACLNGNTGTTNQTPP